MLAKNVFLADESGKGFRFAWLSLIPIHELFDSLSVLLQDVEKLHAGVYAPALILRRSPNDLSQGANRVSCIVQGQHQQAKIVLLHGFRKRHANSAGA
jgi:hypothetical protein